MDPPERLEQAFGGAFPIFGGGVGPPSESMYLRQREEFFVGLHMPVPRNPAYFEQGHSPYENRAGVNLDFFGDLGLQTVVGGEADHQYHEVCPTSKEVEISDIHSEVEDPRPSETSNPRGTGLEAGPGGGCGSEAEEGVEQDNEGQEICGTSQEAERDCVHVQQGEQTKQLISRPEGLVVSNGHQSLQSEVLNGTRDDYNREGHEEVRCLESESQSMTLEREVLNDTRNDLNKDCHDLIPYLESESPPVEGPRPLTWKSSHIGIFSVQCGRCYKWRVIPTREIYESIREHILEMPWFCEKAIQWRRDDAHCGLPTDLVQDSRTLWAMDKPNLPACPPGWQRKIVVRRDSSSRFADVYYTAPSGKVLRSMPDVAKYLELHGQASHDVTLDKFSFTAPRPLPGVWTSSRTKKKSALVPTSNSEICEDHSKKARNT